jgi:hypothetical protein
MYYKIRLHCCNQKSAMYYSYYNDDMCCRLDIITHFPAAQMS